jgi:hypothetical protein
MSGWINYSGIVTSQKMSENKMGDCGSKSVIHETKQSCIIVKEQRVNGSWCGINIPHLRCTLLGFVRSYQVKTLSNQIIQRQFYSSESNLDNSQQPQDPWFISGSPSDSASSSDAEGCFMVLVRKSPKSKLGWQIEANFTINLHVRDLDLLKLIQSLRHYFGVGRIGKERNGCRESLLSPSDYTIGSLDQIITKVRALHPSLRLPLGTQARQEPLILIEL